MAACAPMRWMEAGAMLWVLQKRLTAVENI